MRGVVLLPGWLMINTSQRFFLSVMLQFPIQRCNVYYIITIDTKQCRILHDSSDFVHRGVPYACERWEQQQQLPRGEEDRKTRRERSDLVKWITRERAKVDRIACPWLIS